MISTLVQFVREARFAFVSKYHRILYDQARKYWMIRAGVPPYVISPTEMSSMVTHFGSHEIVEPTHRISFYPADAPYLKRNTLPAVLPKPYWCEIENGVCLDLIVLDPSRPHHVFLELFSEPHYIQRNLH